MLSFHLCLFFIPHTPHAHTHIHTRQQRCTTPFKSVPLPSSPGGHQPQQEEEEEEEEDDDDASAIASADDEGQKAAAPAPAAVKKEEREEERPRGPELGAFLPKVCV